jgi:hypothetical protein
VFFFNGNWILTSSNSNVFAASLLGTTLAPNVVASSLTSVGALTSLVVGNPTGGNKGPGTSNNQLLYQNGVPVIAGLNGTFTGNLTGYATTVTTQVNYWIAGNQCTLTSILGATGASNDVTMVMNGLPSAVQPATGTPVVLCQAVNGTGNLNLICSAQLQPGGSINFNIGLVVTIAGGSFSSVQFSNPGGFDNPSSHKGLPPGWTITYTLD